MPKSVWGDMRVLVPDLMSLMSCACLGFCMFFLVRLDRGEWRSGKGAYDGWVVVESHLADIARARCQQVDGDASC